MEIMRFNNGERIIISSDTDFHASVQIHMGDDFAQYLQGIWNNHEDEIYELQSQIDLLREELEKIKEGTE